MFKGTSPIQIQQGLYLIDLSSENNIQLWAENQDTKSTGLHFLNAKVGVAGVSHLIIP